MCASMVVALVLTLIFYKKLIPIKMPSMDTTDAGGPKVASLWRHEQDIWDLIWNLKISILMVFKHTLNCQN